jgi:hypothetical protein
MNDDLSEKRPNMPETLLRALRKYATYFCKPRLRGGSRTQAHLFWSKRKARPVGSNLSLPCGFCGTRVFYFFALTLQAAQTAQAPSATALSDRLKTSEFAKKVLISY